MAGCGRADASRMGITAPGEGHALNHCSDWAAAWSACERRERAARRPSAAKAAAV